MYCFLAITKPHKWLIYKTIATEHRHHILHRHRHIGIKGWSCRIYRSYHSSLGADYRRTQT